MTMTFAQLLTPEGIVGAAALVVTLVQVIKAALPIVDARVSGALLAFMATGILYALAAWVLPDRTPDSLLQVFAAWVAVAGLAMGIKAGADHVDEVRHA
jgi:hypothetical protein